MFPFRPSDLLDLSECPAVEVFDGCEFVWQAMPRFEGFIKAKLKRKFRGKKVGRPFIGKDVFVGEGTVVEDGAFIKGPAIIGCNCRVASGAYVRENVIVGDGCVLGHASEFKNCLLFNRATVPHFNYVGDSVLGHKAHLGAGVILSNVKLIAGNVFIEHEGKRLDTGLRKFGAIIGDRVEIGCNAVLNPASIVGRRSLIYAGVMWRGYCPADTVVKLKQEWHEIERRA